MDFEIPFSVKAVFFFTVLFVFFGWLTALAKIEMRKSLFIPAILALGGWIVVQGILGGSDFYLVTDVLPPRIIFAVLPPALIIVAVFVLPQGKALMDRLDPKQLTYIHLCRIPVEFVLLRLFLAGAIPQLMTFEGRNFDILTGATALPLIYFAYKKYPHRHLLPLLWNFAGLALLLNIVVNSILSAPGPLQLQAFDQPNYGVLILPFIWLPSFIVPSVLFIHLVCIRHHLKAYNS